MTHLNMVGMATSALKHAHRGWVTRPSLVQMMPCSLLYAKPLSEPILAYCQLSVVVISISFQHQYNQYLIHWGQDKMTSIFQVTFSNGFSSMKIYEVSLKFVPEGPNNNIPALVQIMASHWPGYKPLSEPMMIILLTHIYTPLCLNELIIRTTI